MRLIILLTLAFAILNSTTFAEDCTATHISAGKPMASMGIMVGEVTPRSAYIQVRLSTTDKLVDRDLPGTPGVVEFTLTTKNKSNAAPSVQLVPATEAHDFISRAVFSKLKPGSQYICMMCKVRFLEFVRPQTMG